MSEYNRKIVLVDVLVCEQFNKELGISMCKNGYWHDTYEVVPISMLLCGFQNIINMR
jgi:hypothetical protein